jgi:hypothetical protein
MLCIIVHFSYDNSLTKFCAIIFYRYMSKNDKPIDFSYVGLALPGQPGSWQGECKVLYLYKKPKN